MHEKLKIIKSEQKSYANKYNVVIFIKIFSLQLLKFVSESDLTNPVS